MSDPKDLRLPIVGHSGEQDPSDDAPACSPEVYVTNEEAAVVAAMRALKERATEVRERLSKDPPEDQRATLLTELDELRTHRSELAQRREQAYRNKMVMLGHLPPDALLD